MSPDTAIDRILELSAEAQAKRRETADDSPGISKINRSCIGLRRGIINLLTKLRADYYRQQRTVKTLAAFAYLSARDFGDLYQGR